MELSSLEGFGSKPRTFIRDSRLATLSWSSFEHRIIICLAWAECAYQLARHGTRLTSPQSPGGAVLGLVACAVPSFSQRYLL